MHYFHIGGDDRVFLNNLCSSIKQKNVSVQNEPLSLVDTMKLFKGAYLNIGMRFHSILLQTVLSGKNYILDYTDPDNGKIIGFLRDIDDDSFLIKRYISLQNLNSEKININFNTSSFEFKKEIISKMKNIYLEEIKKINENFNSK